MGRGQAHLDTLVTSGAHAYRKLREYARAFLNAKLGRAFTYIYEISRYFAPARPSALVAQTFMCPRNPTIRSCHGYGYSFRGMRAECKRCLVWGTRISVIAAMCWDKGIHNVEVTSNSVNGEMFCDLFEAVWHHACFNLMGSPNSIMVMENCSIYHVAEVGRCWNTFSLPFPL